MKKSLEPANVHGAHGPGQQMSPRLALAILQQAGTNSKLKTLLECGDGCCIHYVLWQSIVHQSKSKQRAFEDLTFTACGQIRNLHVVFGCFEACSVCTNACVLPIEEFEECTRRFVQSTTVDKSKR